MSDARRLALGTAQWGQRYGVANRAGVPSPDELQLMAETAWAAGIRILDTARAYGSAEEAVGRLPQPWRVITKLDPAVAGPDVSPPDAAERARASLAASRVALGRDALDSVLLHRSAHRHDSGGAAWSVLADERAAGRIGQIGASAESPDAAWGLLEDPDVEAVQVATSLLDLRLVRSGFFERAAALRRVVLVRSVYLQGVAHLPASGLPEHLVALRPVLERLDARASDEGVGTADLFLGWARHRLPSATLLIGCETVAQLDDNLRAWAGTAHYAESVRGLEELIPQLPEAVLDPSAWPRG